MNIERHVFMAHGVEYNNIHDILIAMGDVEHSESTIQCREARVSPPC